MKKLLLSLFILVAIATKSYATHVMGADITYTCLGGNDYMVTLTLYRDCSGSTIGTTPQTVNFSSSCGAVNGVLDWVSTTDVSQVCPTQTTTCNGGTLPGTEQYVFSGIVNLPPCADWVMSWELCCRNDGITNLVSPGSNDLYVQNTMNNILGPCNNSPQFLALPTPYLCPGQLTMYNHGASDVDGDSLYYQFSTPLSGPGAPIAFAGGYSQSNPVITSSGMNLNPLTGEMCFTPSVTQICVISVTIYEYRDNVLIGTQIREMQVVVAGSCANTAPYAGAAPTCGNVGGMVITHAGPTVVQTDSNSISMCPFDSLCFQISFTDPDGNHVTVTSNAATSIPGANFNIVNNGSLNPIGYFCWVPTPLDSGMNILTVHLMDDACPISASQYYTYDITVFDQPYAGPDQIICGPQWAQLNASGGAGYTWSVLSGSPLSPGVNITCNPCANPQVKPAVTTTYLLTSSLTAACVNTDTVTITVVPDFTVTPFGATTLCDYLSTPIGVNVAPAAGAYTYSWNNSSTLSNANISNPNASPTATTTYIATVTSPFGCVKKDSVVVGLNPPPTLTLSPGDTAICLGGSLNFAIESTCMYTLDMVDSWGDGWNGQSISVYDNGVLVGTYTVPTGTNNTATFPITNGNNITLVYVTGSFQSESSFNLINGMGVTQFSVAAGGMTGWVDGNTYYSGTGNCGPTLSSYTFNWSPAAGLSSTTIQNPLATPLTTTTYTVTLSDAGGCTVNRSQTITVVPNYSLNSTQSDNTVCLGETVNFNTTATPAGVYNYTWSPASIMDNPSIASPTATFNTPGLNTIIVDVDNGGGCLKSDTMFVNVSPAYAPTINILNNDTSLSCSGNESVTINLDLGGGIPATCGASASAACSGASTTLSVGTTTGANTTTTWPAPYGNWYRNAKHQFLYTATELNAMGFIGGKITQIGWQVTAINGTTAYNSYTIKMKCTSATSLTAWESGLIQVFNPKTVNIAVGMNMHTLDVAYEWDGISNLVVEICYDNLAVSYTNNSITPWTTTGFISSYYFYSDSSPACPSTTNSGSSNNRPVTRFTTCPTTPDPTAFTYSWSPIVGVSNPTIQNPVLSPSSTTNYVVTVTDPVGGCYDTDSILITVNSLLTGTFTTFPPTCSSTNDGQIIVTGNSPNPPFTVEFYDSTGVTLLQTHTTTSSDTLNNVAPGTYLVNILDSVGCGFDTLITVSTTPPVLLTSISNDTTICINELATISASGSGGTGSVSLIWDNGLVGDGPHAVSPLLNTTYIVFAQDSLGCVSASDSLTITMNPDATLLLTSVSGTDAQTVCINTSITNINYTIGGGGTGATITGLPTGVTGSYNAGIYTITGTPSDTGSFTYIINTTGTCQQLADTGTITIIPDATISLSSAIGTNAQTVCINTTLSDITYNIGGGGTNATIAGLPAGVIGTYSTGVFTISGTPTTIGTFNYTINTSGTCVQASAIGSITLLDSLHLNPLNLSRDTICPDDTTSISANPATGGSGVGYTYTWYDSNNNQVGTGLNIIVLPTTDIETYTLVVGDNCTTPTISQSVIVHWSPLPKPSFMVINTAGCYPVLASFMNTTPNSASINSVQWNFGDGQTSNNIVNVDHSYNTPGCFDVNLSVTSIVGCFRDTTLQNAVCAYDYPVADFTMSPQPTDVTNPFISFTNQSYGNVENFWSFSNGIPSYSLDVNPISEFPSDTPGTYLVELAIINSHGCPDTITRTVVIDGLYLFYIPNTFTPNGDERNDFFRPYGDGVDWSKYHFMIFDRWGEKVFETDNVEEGWDGTYKGNPAQSGVYVWKIKAKELYRNVNTEHSGHVNLIR